MFYERLKSICEEKGISFNTVIKECNISSGNISKWKSGGEPRAESLKKISEYLNVSIDYLLGMKDTELLLTKEEAELIIKYRMLPGGSQVVILSNIERELLRR